MHSFFSPLVFQMTHLNFASPECPVTSKLSLLFGPTTHLVRQQSRPLLIDRRASGASAPLRHVQVQPSLSSRCGFDSRSTVSRTSDRSRSKLRPGSSSSSRSRASSSSRLSPYVFFFLSTSLLFFSQHLCDFSQALPRAALVVAFALFLPFLSTSSESLPCKHDFSISSMPVPFFASSLVLLLTSLSFLFYFGFLDRFLLPFPLVLRLLDRFRKQRFPSQSLPEAEACFVTLLPCAAVRVAANRTVLPFLLSLSSLTRSCLQLSMSFLVFHRSS